MVLLISTQQVILCFMFLYVTFAFFQRGKVGRVEGAVPRAQGWGLHPHGSQVERQIWPDAHALLNLSLGKQK